MSAIEGVRYEDFDGKEESLQGYLSLFHGQKPRYEVFESETGQHEFILNTVKELLQSDATLKPSDIVIATRLQAGFKNIIPSFHQQKTAYYNLRDGVGNENGVHFCTFHSLKGLEYKVVILANINERSFPFKPADYNRWSDDRKERHLKSEKSLMYTAMTRAIAQLYLTGVGVAAGDFGEG
jgi:superfamily I DNA/RNA helicase